MADCLVFASGRGSNFIAIHEHLKTTNHGIGALVCDKPEAGAITYAREQKIPVLYAQYPAPGSAGREAGERSILEGIAKLSLAPKLLVLAGFMRVLSAAFVDRFAGKIINIHPSLLPKYAGAHGIAESIASGDDRLGITIHYVDHGVDTGPIILQRSFERIPGESPEEEERRIHVLEHSEYPLVVAALLDHTEERSV